ncbi:hypothetical protein PIB30_047422 [Stylosanthes scabra]|uniref:Uncharacterized protein n=1 Tax=Stylosanthes scabra TaxID=79078 RepID=A0ABU6THF3_9FABA|nr:hypothetical protein [Stylosanthes scabra]
MARRILSKPPFRGVHDGVIAVAKMADLPWRSTIASLHTLCSTLRRKRATVPSPLLAATARRRRSAVAFAPHPRLNPVTSIPLLFRNFLSLFF